MAQQRTVFVWTNLDRHGDVTTSWVFLSKTPEKCDRYWCPVCLRRVYSGEFCDDCRALVHTDCVVYLHSCAGCSRWD